MSKPSVCFVVMPFKPELHYFYLFIQKYLSEKHSLRVERGDAQVLTRPLIEKIRDQIFQANVILADVTGANPNVLYEVGVAHALAKPVIFLTQDDPVSAPIDVRLFEFIRYDLNRHEEFLAKLDNAIQNVFIGNYRELYDGAIDLLRKFNEGSGSAYIASSMEVFQARVMKSEQMQDIPSAEKPDLLAKFLLPKVLTDTADVMTMRRVMDWIDTLGG
jgi:hypothetical protein